MSPRPPCLTSTASPTRPATSHSAGAIYWSGIGHVVYALPEKELREIAGPPTLALPCREVLAHGTLPVLVEGPFLLEEARRVHEGFWTAHVNGPRRA